jgi:transcriptional regulator with XRE-family HTH domain
MDSKKVGKTIAFLRKQYGMTQGELADRLHVTDKAVSRWERGLGSPDVSLLTQLSIILDTDIESILEGNLTSHELGWSGVLNLNYSDGIRFDEYMFGKRIVYFQLSLLMLAGIRNICIRGSAENVDFVKKEMSDSAKLGLILNYEPVECEGKLELAETLKEWQERISGNDGADCNGVMVINGLDFLYGKDVTKMFRRVMYDMKAPVQLMNFKRNSTSIYFFPNTENTKKCIEAMSGEDSSQQCSCEMSSYVMERGVIIFPLKTDDDLLDASTLLRILEKHQNEKVADLAEIAVRRGMVEDVND